MRNQSEKEEQFTSPDREELSKEGTKKIHLMIA